MLPQTEGGHFWTLVLFCCLCSVFQLCFLALLESAECFGLSFCLFAKNFTLKLVEGRSLGSSC